MKVFQLVMLTVVVLSQSPLYAGSRRSSSANLSGTFHGIQFSGATFRASSGYCDLHLEVVSADGNKVTISMADSLTNEKLEANGGVCSGYTGCSGGVSLAICEPSGLCYSPQDQAKTSPELALMPDGNILVDYGGSTAVNLLKLTRSNSDKWWRCGR